MAIKGKRRGKSRPRGVASAPRPFLVPPRTPPLRRRPVQVFLILLVLGGFVALGAGLRASQDAQERKEDVQQFGSQVEAAFSTSGIIQSFGATPIVLPEIQAAFAQLQRAKLDPANLRADADRWEQSATDLADSISRLDAQSVGLKEARELMEQSLRLYASVAQEIGIAADLDAGDREALVGTLQQQLEIARSLFDFGMSSLATERALADIQVQPVVPPGLQPGIPQP